MTRPAAERGLVVGYDGTAAARQRAGIGRYARELLRGLARIDNTDAYRVFWAASGADVGLPRLNERFRTYPLPVSDRILNLAWQRLRLPMPVESRTGRLDVFHCPDFSLPPSWAPAIVTVHDLAFEVLPQLSYPTLAAYLRATVPRAVRRASAVIAPSESTKAAILRHYGTPADKVHVIPEGVDTCFGHGVEADSQVTLERLGVNTPYILAVGTLEPRKNLVRLLEAFAIVRESFTDMKLVIAGRPGWMYDGIFRKQAELGLGNAAKFLTNTSDADLRMLYQSALITVCASLYEGFCLPALEALSCGSPVACSGNSSIPEITGDAGVMFDPWDVSDMAQTISSLLDDEDARSRLSRAGRERALLYTWDRTARATSTLYHVVAN